MNHISYELALLRRDELLREAAERRLAQHAAAAQATAPSLELASGPSKLRRVAAALRGRAVSAMALRPEGCGRPVRHWIHDRFRERTHRRAASTSGWPHDR